MNVYIQSDAQLILQWNEQKATACAQPKTTLEYQQKETTKGHEEVLKLPLAKLASEIFLKILGISNWGMGYIFRNAFSQIEKNKELSDIIFNANYLM